MFNESHDFAINNGTFISAGRDVKISNDEERGLHTLYWHTSTSALFNAEARFPPPLCHPGTRETILRELKDWVKQDTPQVFPHDSSIRWLYGPAGAGKSAIAQTIAEACAKNGTLAGSFFFWRSDPSRNNPERLFTTLALQITAAIPELRSIMNSVVIRNPSVLTSSIEIQFHDLILQPWFKVQMHQELLEKPSSSYLHNPEKSQSPFSSTLGTGTSSSPLSSTRPQIIVIDGLDECSHSRDQQHILSILKDAMHKHPLPFRILITSRPEPRIKESFNSPQLRTICRWMPLDDNLFRASREIRVFLRDKFQEILHRHLHTMEHVPRPWPADNQIKVLVEKSSGHFIYPSTVLKYIDDDNAVPADRLDVVLGVQALEGTESPFAELDALYRQIMLNAHRDDGKLLRILAAVLVFRAPTFSSDVLVHLLSLEMKSTGALRAALSGVHSLFSGPSPVESNLHFCHASFADFLSNRERSLQFYIDEADAHDYLAQCCLSVFEVESSKAVPKLLALKTNDEIIVSMSVLEYAHSYWAHHHTLACGTARLLSRLDTFNIYSASLTPFQYFTSDPSVPFFFGGFSWSLPDNFLSQAYTIQAHFKSKHNKILQHFLAISTIGFNISIGPGYEIPIRLSAELYSTPPNIMEYIISQLPYRPIASLPGYLSPSLTITPLLAHENLPDC
ncbi:hypothetical protein BDP27DRAFT_1445965 [Rhodocollybia butyracea]|uniref:Nephrocystin 3-like N-terminal domain-containing protein n=1 Tax=Rhodocollybia butyracea TaxID=206335 RepID=A0A9P5Q111_9AGAR|nr:hypothetical protein BDP27DRAFT_1445965 [Rhodocollybia butyracea]